MAKEDISQEFRFKERDEKRNYFVEEIKQNELISKKQKKVCKTSNYIGHFLILALVVTRCVSVSALATFLVVLIGITSSGIGLKICAITAGIRKYKPIIKKKKKKHDEIAL